MGPDELLAAVRGRTMTGDGIGLARGYFSTLVPCLGDGLCRVRAFELGNPEEWLARLKDAETRLVYCDADMVATGGAAKGDPAPREWGDKGGKELTPGACMDFDCVITSKRQDRDGDVLESGGAEVDERSPLLWQHIPMMPIGKLLKVTGQNKSRVTGRCSILDFPLGHDAALLVEFGALRISHGFIPLEFEPLEGKDGDAAGVRRGYRVIRFKVLEVSVVSVPSNEDAVITQFSRGKLHHPFVKSWADDLRRRLPRRAAVDGLPPGLTVNVNLPAAASPAQPAKAACGCDGGEPHGHRSPAPDGAKPYPNEHSCRLNDPGKYDKFRRQNKKADNGKTYGLIFGHLKKGDKWELQAIRFPKADWPEAEARKRCKENDGGSFEAAGGKGPGDVTLAAPGDKEAPFYITGSWEWTEDRLEDSAPAYLAGAGLPPPQGADVDLAGTFPGWAVISVCSGGGMGGMVEGEADETEVAFFRGTWEDGAAGPAWTGRPEPVSLNVTVAGPAGEAGADAAVLKEFLRRRAFKMAKRDLAKLKEARTLLGELGGKVAGLDGDAKAGMSALLEKSERLLAEVIAAAEKDPPPGGGPAAAVGLRLCGELMGSAELPLVVLDDLAALVGAARDKARERETLAALTGIM